VELDDTPRSSSQSDGGKRGCLMRSFGALIWRLRHHGHFLMYALHLALTRKQIGKRQRRGGHPYGCLLWFVRTEWATHRIPCNSKVAMMVVLFETHRSGSSNRRIFFSQTQIPTGSGKPKDRRETRQSLMKTLTEEEDHLNKHLTSGQRTTLRCKLPWGEDNPSSKTSGDRVPRVETKLRTTWMANGQFSCEGSKALHGQDRPTLAKGTSRPGLGNWPTARTAIDWVSRGQPKPLSGAWLAQGTVRPAKRFAEKAIARTVQAATTNCRGKGIS
jgi:hypothetical protein